MLVGILLLQVVGCRLGGLWVAALPAVLRFAGLGWLLRRQLWAGGVGAVGWGLGGPGRSIGGEWGQLAGLGWGRLPQSR